MIVFELYLNEEATARITWAQENPHIPGSATMGGDQVVMDAFLKWIPGKLGLRGHAITWPTARPVDVWAALKNPAMGKWPYESEIVLGEIWPDETQLAQGEVD